MVCMWFVCGNFDVLANSDQTRIDHNITRAEEWQ